VLRGCQGVFRVCRGFDFCQTRLKLSCEVDECKPLTRGATRFAHNWRRLRARNPTMGVGAPTAGAGSTTVGTTGGRVAAAAAGTAAEAGAAAGRFASRAAACGSRESILVLVSIPVELVERFDATRCCLSSFGGDSFGVHGGYVLLSNSFIGVL